MSANPLHIGIVGAGRIGKVHAETVAFGLPEAEIVSITDVNRDAALEVAGRCGIPTVAASSQEILSDARVDAVLSCSSTGPLTLLTRPWRDATIDSGLGGCHGFAGVEASGHGRPRDRRGGYCGRPRNDRVRPDRKQ